MMKHIAIPVKFLDNKGGVREDLTPEEQADLAANYGDQPMSDVEIAERLAEEAAWANGAAKRAAVNQIAELEAMQTPRRMREAALGIDGGWLENINAQIATLRSQMNG